MPVDSIGRTTTVAVVSLYYMCNRRWHLYCGLEFGERIYCSRCRPVFWFRICDLCYFNSTIVNNTRKKILCPGHMAMCMRIVEVHIMQLCTCQTCKRLKTLKNKRDIYSTHSRRIDGTAYRTKQMYVLNAIRYSGPTIFQFLAVYVGI